jgi:hypothetical protein
MVNAVEFVIGLAIATMVVSIFYLVKIRRGGATDRDRARLSQAMTMFAISAVLAIAGEIYIRLR